MAQAPSDLGQRIVLAARLATVTHIRAVINEMVVARRIQARDGRSVMPRPSLKINRPAPPPAQEAA